MELSAFAAAPAVLPGTRRGVTAAGLRPAAARPLRPAARPSTASRAPPPAPRMAGRSSGGGDAFNFPGLGDGSDGSGGGGGGGGGGFFDSPIVRAEGQALMRDHEALRRLGRGYGSFDAAGQRLYIQASEQLFDRWLVMIKRLELSPDFAAQLHRRQLLDHIAESGMTFDAFVAQTRHAFAMMRSEVRD